MAKILAVLLLPAFLSQVFCLQCNTCHGEYNCVGENVTCTDPSASCTTSVRKAYVSFMEFQSVRKGCARQLYPPESISINSHLLSLSYQARYCAEDGCNNETYFVSHPPPANHMRCHTCASQGAWCPETSRTQITCVGDQDQCVDMDITGKLGQYSNLKLKGCTNLQRCEDTMSFYSGGRTIHTSCCNTPLCNSFNPDLHILSQALNGLECYSCVDDDGSMSGCSSKSMSKVQCMGIHTMCLEGIGHNRKAGKDLGLVTFKGCASPAMCQSNLLALVQELDNAEVMCCQGNLCNDRIVDGVVTEARVSADSADIEGGPECVMPTPAQPGVASAPDCTYSEEEEESKLIVPAPAGVSPSSGSHINTETPHTVREKEATEDFVTEGAAVTDSPQHEVHSDKHKINEDLSGGSSEGNTVSPTGSTGSEDLPSGGSSATTNLDKSGAGTNNTSSSANIVVLVPVVVSKRNKTATATTTSSSSSTNNKVLEASNNNGEFEEEECEAAEEEDVSTRDQLFTAGERNREGSTSGGNDVPAGERNQAESSSLTEQDHNTGVFNADPRRPTDSPAMAGNSHGVHSHSTGGERFVMEGNPASRTPSLEHSGTGNPAATGGESLVADPSASRPGHSTSGLSIEGAHLAVPFVPPKANESFVAEGNASGPSGAGVASGAGTATARPKNKVPCKQPRSQAQRGGKLVASSGAEKQVRDEGTPRDATNTLFSETKNPGHAGGKVNLGSGAFGLSGNLHLFSLGLILLALLH